MKKYILLTLILLLVTFNAHAGPVVSGSGSLGDGVAVEIDASASQTLLPFQVSGTILSNFGQTAANTQILPPAAAGMNFIAPIATAGQGAFNIKAGTSDKIYLAGVALDGADKVSNAAPAIGDSITFWTFKSSASTWDWMAAIGVGTWIDGGA